MPLSKHFPDQPKKKLKFHCTNCGAEIITQYLEPGDEFLCPYCKVKTIVPREPTPWGVRSVVIFAIAYFLGTLIALAISVLMGMALTALFDPGYSFEGGIRDDTANTISLIIFTVIEFVFPLVLIYYSVVKRHNNSFFQSLHLQRLTKTNIIRYSGITAIVLIGVILYSYILEFTPLRHFVPEDTPMDRIFQEGYFKVAWFSFVALLAPFREELIFRGYIFEGLKHRLGPVASGIVVTIAFVFLHAWQLSYSPFLLFPILIVAVVLIAIRIKTDSLTNSIMVHQLYNTALIAITWIWIAIFGSESLT